MNLAFLLSFVAIVGVANASYDCASGLLGTDADEEPSIDKGHWYLSLEHPSTCSGYVNKYEVEYYGLEEDEFHNVQVAVWEHKGDGEYAKISLTKELLVQGDDDKKRRKRASTQGSVSGSVSNVFVRKGAVVGVYFKPNKTPMPVIGSTTSGNHQVCKYQGPKEPMFPINCTLLMVNDLVIHAEAQIVTIECDENNIASIDNGDYDLIEGDTEYGARAQYSCDTGYEFDSAGDGIVMCNENMNWVGDVPTCAIITCDMEISTPVNGIILSGEGNTSYGQNIIFSCQTGYELVGSSSIVCLADGNWNDSVPTCNITECDELNPPVNGDMIGSGITYGSTIQFSCNTGYELSVHDQSNVTCQADETWSGSVPQCIPVNCSDPGTPVNGMKSSAFFTLGSVVTFTCNEGYYLNDSRGIVCEADKSWNSTIPQCLQINCGDPGVPNNGSASGMDYFYESIVTFDCDEGFELNGSRAIICGEDNQWNSSLPSCNPVNCGAPLVDNDTISVTPSVYTFTTIIMYECVGGYELNGSSSAVCQANGEWNVSAPSCDLVSCGYPGTPHNASIVTVQPSYTYSSVVQYACDEGFDMLGWPVIECEETKQWNGSLPECAIVDCSDPGIPVNGMRLDDGDSFSYQTKVTFGCNSGYQLEGDSSIVCNSSGLWDSPLPTCNPVSCNDPGMITSGSRSATGFTYGHTVEYNCSEGYQLFGSKVLICTENGNWNSSTPFCTIVDCEAILQLDNGIVNGQNFTYGSTLSFSCEDGYLLSGQSSITCQSDNTWSSSLPTCNPVDCGNPGEVNMGMVTAKNGSYTFGSQVSFTCVDGYEIVNGSDTITCQSDGNWTDVVPTCSIVSCGEPNSPVNGHYSGNSFTYGSRVNFFCDSGYSLIGSTMLICTKSKNWSGPTPVCKRQCPNIVSSSVLVIEPEKTTYVEGDVISVSCPSGYYIEGTDTLSCRMNGLWNESIPTCKANPKTTTNGASSESPATLLRPEATSESNESGSSSVVLLGAVIGAVIFFIFLAVVSTILLLLLFQNRKRKKKYNVQDPYQENPMKVYSEVHGSNCTDNQIELKGLKPGQQRNTVVGVPFEGAINSNSDDPASANGRMNRVASAYEVPVTLQRSSAGDSAATMQGSFSPAEYAEVDLSVRCSAYEVPIETLQRNQQTATLVKKDLSKVDPLVETDLPPPIISETSFNEDQFYMVTDVSDCGAVNQVYMENENPPQVYSDISEAVEGVSAKTATIQIYSDISQEIEDTNAEFPTVPQAYSDLNQAFEGPRDSTDTANLLYSEIDCNNDPLPSAPSSQNQVEKRKTVVFEPPAEETNDLYIQLKRQKVNGIRNECIHLGKFLGSGYFGKVYKAEMKVDPSDEDTMEVAVKTLNAKASERDKIKFLQEAATMAQFNHINVLKLHGVVVTKTSCMIVTELMAKGDLLKVLHKMRPDPGQLINEDMLFNLLNFSRQVCLGLSYLSQKGFVHRDIAARNILVDANGTCKVADFGLSRDLEDDDYYMANEGAKIPVKWTAPEALHYRKYSWASDVWSYGCLLYEIWTLGTKPFQGMTNLQSLQKVTEGYRLPPPPGCSKEIYNMMIRCWHPEKDERPSFQDLMLTMLMQDKKILLIPEEDLSTHPLAGTIGATLEAGEKMYEKLQMTYR